MRYENALFGKYFLKCYIVKIILISFNFFLSIPDKKETHHVELINSQEDHKWLTSFFYIVPKVCQLLNHFTSFATRGQKCVKENWP